MLKMLTSRDIAAILTLVKLVMLFNNLRSIKAQEDCDNYPCFGGGTCVMGSSGVMPFCTISCVPLFSGSTCMNPGTCIDRLCHCPPDLAAPNCNAQFAAYLHPTSISVTEGHVGRKTVTVQVCRQPPTEEITLQVYTRMTFAAAQATETIDYEVIPFTQEGNVVLPQGHDCAPVTVTIISDWNTENDESFLLILQSPMPNVYIVSTDQTATITITNDDPDNEPPVITNCPDDIIVGVAPGASPTPVSWIPPTVTDNSGDFTLMSSHQPGQPFPLGTETVTYTATDQAPAQNMNRCMFSVTVLSVSIQCPALLTISAGSTLPASDNPSCTSTNVATATLSVSTSSCSPGSVIRQDTEISCTCVIYPNIRCTFMVYVTGAPLDIECPNDLMVPKNSQLMYTNPQCMFEGSDVVFSGSCSPASQSTITSDVEVMCTCPHYQLIRCTFMVIVVDSEAPVFTNCPGNILVSVEHGMSSASASWTEPTATDNEGMVTVTSTHQSGQLFPVGTDTVTYTATDAAGNEAQCVFAVTVLTVEIQCPGTQTISAGSTLPTSTNPSCVSTNVATGVSFTSTSNCSPGSTIQQDTEISCTCAVYPNIQCTFMVVVTANVECPDTVAVLAGDQLSFSNPLCMFMGRSSQSTCNPSSGSRVFEETSVTCTCNDYPDSQCNFQVVTQMSCGSVSPCNDKCYCEAATCSDQQGVCSSECRIFGCPVSSTSQSLSQVNPQSSVEIQCILEGSVGVHSQLSIRLSRSKDSPDVSGLGGISSSGQTGSRRESTATVHNVSEDDIFYCILTMNTDIIGSVNVTGFVYNLPYILDKPTEISRSTTSITISWRPWDPAIDIGDPPVVAYIPYYRMDPSQDWINGSVIPTDLSLEFTASNLASDRNYTFSIAAVREGEGGKGPRGPLIIIKTLCFELLPSSVSTALTALGDVSVSWKSPENVDCSTGITQFTVYYDIEGDITTRQKAGTTDGTSRSFIVDGSLLESGTTYNFYVTVTTDQEGALSGATEDSQLIFDTDMIVDAGSSAVYLVILVIPFLLLCIVVVIIFRRYQKKSRTDDELEDARDANYDNAGVTVDPEDYIALDEKSRNKATEEYQGLSGAVRHEKKIQETAVTSFIDKLQRRPEHRQSNYQYEDVHPDAASLNLATVPELDQQSQDESEYEVPEMFNEYAGVYVNTQNVINPSPPTPIKVTDFKNFMKRGRSEVIEEIIQQFMALQRGKQHPWNAALKLQNKPKNFFKSLLP